MLENQIIQQGYKLENSSSTTNKIHNIFFTKSLNYYPDIHRTDDLSKHLENISDEYLYEKYAEYIQSQYKHNLKSFMQIKQLYNDNIIQNGLEAFYRDSIRLPKNWKKPEKVNISFNHSYVFTSFDNLLHELNKEEDKTKYDNFVKFKALYSFHDISGLPHYQRSNWQYFFKYLGILNFISGAYQSTGKGVNGDLIEKSIDEIDDDKNRSIDKLINFYSQNFEIKGALYEAPKEYFKKVNEAIFTLEKFNDFYKNGMFSISIENNFDGIISLIGIHKALTVTVAGFLSFSLFPYFSDGHQEFFNLFAKIYMAINTPFVESKRLRENDTILLLLDEPDNYLHPNWQKQLLDVLVNFLSANYKQYNFQLLVTSHSLFILSDLPKGNVIFLEKYDKNDDIKNVNQKIGNCKNATKDIVIKTFGANIHTLLSHGFFMSDGLMGEFAKSKIEEIKKFYDFNQKFKAKINAKGKIKERVKKYYLNKKEKFNHIQSIIGEQFLQAIIKNYLDELEEIFGSETYKNRKKEELLKQFSKEELQKYLDEKND